jgi:hypothetical protein
MGLLACGSLPALAQGSSGTPEAVLDEGRPAIQFCGGGHDCYTVAYVDYGGKPAFRFFGSAKLSPESIGFLYVGRDRITFEPKNPKYGFDTPRADLVQGISDAVRVVFVVRQGSYPFMLWARSRLGTTGGSREREAAEAQTRRWLALAISDFSSAEQEFKRLTASLNLPPQAAPAPVQGEPAKPSPPPKLVLSTQPGNVGVYVDDEFKGISSGEGRLVVSNLTPGNHHLRFTVIGYKELSQSLDLAAGETKTVEAKLDPAGPKPLALAEIEEALTNGLPPKGITKLVIQYGVDFAFTKEVEQRLREKGADSDLLLAIATNQK